jgi:putative transposase
VSETPENLAIMRLLDEQYYKTPFYGVRRLTAFLKVMGYHINRKRVKRLMDLIGWETLYQEPNTSAPNVAHKIYPYLLKGLKITKANQYICF